MADVIQANSISFANNVLLNFTANTVLYIGVYAATFTQFMIRVDPVNARQVFPQQIMREI
jgi:hypothetical protein